MPVVDETVVVCGLCCDVGDEVDDSDVDSNRKRGQGSSRRFRGPTSSRDEPDDIGAFSGKFLRYSNATMEVTGTDPRVCICNGHAAFIEDLDDVT